MTGFFCWVGGCARPRVARHGSQQWCDTKSWLCCLSSPCFGVILLTAQQHAKACVCKGCGVLPAVVFQDHAREHKHEEVGRRRLVKGCLPGQVWDRRVLPSSPSFPKQIRTSNKNLGIHLEVPDIILPEVSDQPSELRVRCQIKVAPPNYRPGIISACSQEINCQH